MQELKDGALKERLEAAIDRYYVARGAAEKNNLDMADYDDNQISVYRLPSYADIKYGIHLKKTDEYGVYSFFVHDDGKISTSYCRSEPTFSNESHLM